MSIKPVLVPDHTADDLRALMDQFNEVTTAPRKKQLTESTEAGVAEGLDKENRARLRNLITADTLNFYSLNNRIPKISEFSRSVKSKLNSLEFDERSELYRQGTVQALKLLGKQGVAEGIMDTVKQAFNDNVAAWPMGTSDEQFIKSWADDIRDRTGRDIPAEKLARLYQDYTRRSPDVMQSHGTTNEESGVAEAGENGYPKPSPFSLGIRAALGSDDPEDQNNNEPGSEDDDEWQRGYEYGVSKRHNTTLGVRKLSPKRSRKEKPLDYEKLAAFFNQYAPDRNITKAFNQHVQNQKDKDNQDVTEGGRPDVMRHAGDKTVRVVKRGGRPIGEIGTDAEASPGNGAYYVKLYDGTYDAVGFDTAEEALAELRYAVKQMSEGVAEAEAKGPFARVKTETLQQFWDSHKDEQNPAPVLADKLKRIRQELVRRKRADVTEGTGAENNPVVNAITRRIMLQRTDLLSKYGPEKIGTAVDEVADFVGDVEEIGSSDVSGWVRHVEQMLGNREPDVTEQQVDELSPKTLGSYIKKSSADAAERQGDVTGSNQFGKGAEFAVKAFYGDRIQPNPTRTDPRIAKRQAGIDQAVDRLTAEDVAPAFKPGDRVMYLTGFATVVAQDGDAYGIRIDGKPGTQMVPADQIRKPSYDESVAESIDPVEQLRADIRRFAL